MPKVIIETKVGKNLDSLKNIFPVVKELPLNEVDFKPHDEIVVTVQHSKDYYRKPKKGAAS